MREAIAVLVVFLISATTSSYQSVLRDSALYSQKHIKSPYSYKLSFAHDIKVNGEASDAFWIGSILPPLSLKPALNHLVLQGTYQPIQGEVGYNEVREKPGFGNELLLPNVSDKETVVNLAKMTSDAYIFDPREPDWLNTSLGYNFTKHIGWDQNGLRGHVFSTEDNSSVVVSFKGTTIDPREPLRHNDRLNDNLLFSCCCAADNPFFYAPVCDCKTGSMQCNSTCLIQSILQKEVYYTTAMAVMYDIKAMYPNSQFWVVGHSLGGALASLVGQTLGIPAVTYEAPPERLPAIRMGVFQDKGTFLRHFGNTADPIFMGECHGALTTCSFWGFSFESQCFTGRKCTYDTINDKGWRSSVTNHRINFVIENVLKAYETVPRCQTDEDCVDCQEWEFH